jgi:hypothetical protein
MATERQIAANQANSALSTGPRSIEGKDKSRFNAVKHGLAATTTAALIVADGRELVEERKARWLESFRPDGDDQEWHYERLVVESIRIERCHDAFFALCRLHGERARALWDEDRHRDAAELAAGLGRNPTSIARRLRASAQGADLMIVFWKGLLAQLDRHGEWTGPQRSLALDLLGVHKSLRDAETPVDPIVGDIVAARKSLASAEIARLGELRDGRLSDLDASERRLAEQTLGAEFTKPLQLIDRYERAATRRYDAACKVVRTPAPPAVSAPAPKPIAAPVPRPVAVAMAMPAPAIVATPRPSPRPTMNRLERRTLAALQRRA